jgi:outer membrane protein OmpA-like peptidoglycan-associated protein
MIKNPEYVQVPQIWPFRHGRRYTGLAGYICFLVLAFFTGGFLRAQTAGEMDTLLETREINFTQASYFVLTAAETAGEKAEYDAMYALAREKGWLSRKAAPETPIRLGELSYLIMKAFDMKGSFLYSLFPGPRYAFRELDYLKLLPGRRDPALRVSGEQLLWMLGQLLNYTGEPIDVPDVSAQETVIPVPAAETAAAGEQPEQKPDPLPAAEVREPEEEEPAYAPLPAAEVKEPEEEEPAYAPLPAAEPKEPEEEPAYAPLPAAEPKEPEKYEAAPPPVVEAAEPKIRGIEETPEPVKLGVIQFMPDSAGLTEKEKTKLREIAAILPQYPGRKVLVEGYTAMTGSAAGRRQISEARARAVADFLISLGGLRKDQVSVRSYGGQKPLADNSTERGRAINRRVEITLLAN